MFIEYIFLFFIYLFWIREFVKNRDHSYDHIQSNIQITGVINSPLVSVIIPARNEMENISTCLTSVIRQNYNWINSPNADAAAANGQFILIQRSVYEDSGGHEPIRGKILEDVSLAENVKKK